MTIRSEVVPFIGAAALTFGLPADRVDVVVRRGDPVRAGETVVARTRGLPA